MRGQQQQETQSEKKLLCKKVLKVGNERVMLSVHQSEEDGTRIFSAYSPTTSAHYKEEIAEPLFEEISQQLQCKDSKSLLVEMAQWLGIAHRVVSPSNAGAELHTEDEEKDSHSNLPPPPGETGRSNLPPRPPQAGSRPTFRGGCKFQGKHFIVSAREVEPGTLQATVYNPRTCEQFQRMLTAEVFQVYINPNSGEGNLMDLVPLNLEKIVTAVLNPDGSSALNTVTEEPSEESGVEESKEDSGIRPDLLPLVHSTEKQSPGMQCIGGINSAVAGLDVNSEPPLLDQDEESVAESKESENETCAQQKAEALKSAGNTAFEAGLFEEALVLYSKAKEMFPDHLVFRLNCAAAELELGHHDQCVHECKGIISAVRRLQQSIASLKANNPSHSDFNVALDKVCTILGGMSPEAVVSKAYARIGNSFYKRGRWQRAFNAYLLAVKENKDHSDELVQKRMKASFDKLKLSQDASATYPDIEETLKNHILLGNNESFTFGCTRCGECCRTSDYIFLCPYDIFMMTRSPNMVTHCNVTTTIALRQHPDFKDALKYTLKEGYPVCFLRPVKNKSGHCHFAYPLHTLNGNLMDYGETKKEGLEVYRPVHPSEYNLTEEEEEEALKSVQNWEKEKEEDFDAANSSDEEEGPETETEHKEVPPPHYHKGEGDKWWPVPIVNSYGRQALGCTFGTTHMPTMCASYPIANEVSWVDFWHSRESVPEAVLDTPTNSSCAEPPSKSAVVAWPQVEKVMVVKAAACEGFFADNVNKTNLTGDGEPKPTAAQTQTIGQFLTGESDLQARFQYRQEFMALFEQTIKRGLLLKIENEMLKHKYIEQLARIWYDFDSLATARSRPFKTFARLTRTITTLTSTVIEETERFIELQSTKELSAVEQTGDYVSLLTKLNI